MIDNVRCGKPQIEPARTQQGGAMFALMRVLTSATAVLVGFYVTTTLAATLPTDQDIQGVKNLCGAGSIISEKVKGDVDAALVQWRQVSAGAGAEKVKEDLTGALGKIKDDKYLSENYKLYIDCVNSTLQRYIVGMTRPLHGKVLVMADYAHRKRIQTMLDDLTNAGLSFTCVDQVRDAIDALKRSKYISVVSNIYIHKQHIGQNLGRELAAANPPPIFYFLSLEDDEKGNKINGSCLTVDYGVLRYWLISAANEKPLNADCTLQPGWANPAPSRL